MATSGTTNFTLDLTDTVEEAFERCGSELRSGYDLRTARRSLNLMLADWANRGINFFTLAEGSLLLAAGTATYDLPTDTVDILDHVLRTGAGNATLQTDITLTRISASQYAAVPNKLVQSIPLNLMVTRGVTQPTVTLWPVPDNTQTYTLVYWRLRRIQDAGNGVNTPDIPFRFYPAFVAGLAYYLSLKIPGALDRRQTLQQDYAEAWQLAAEEDRDRSTFRLVPRLS